MALVDSGAALDVLTGHFQSMPPVAALQLRIAGFDGQCLRLAAPLAAHVNDKGCAFGGSMASLMTLAAWGVVTLRLQQAGIAADVFVADSELRFRAPLYADLEVEARLDEAQDWDAFVARLHERGRAGLRMAAWVRLPDGGIAAESTARYVAMVKGYDGP
jgi:thioesterase domain-containing protein